MKKAENKAVYDLEDYILDKVNALLDPETDCRKCKHYKGNEKCKAFPEGIPDDIYYGEIPHKKVIPGQEGKYVFTPRK